MDVVVFVTSSPRCDDASTIVMVGVAAFFEAENEGQETQASAALLVWLQHARDFSVTVFSLEATSANYLETEIKPRHRRRLSPRFALLLFIFVIDHNERTTPFSSPLTPPPPIRPEPRSSSS